MTFNDIFKSSFLENVTSVSLIDMMLALILAFGLGMFIFLVYKKTFSGVMYSSGFGVTLVDRGRNRSRRRNDTSGCDRQCRDRCFPPDFCQPEIIR